VIWATGFRSDYSRIEIPGVVGVAHRRGVTDIPGLYLLGLSWQHTRGSALHGFVNDAAAYLADRITTHQHALAPADGKATRHPPG
jgi:putative flavoprotein involved in K+ transport